LGKLVVTSINIDEDLWKKAKIEAIKSGMTVADFLTKQLKKLYEGQNNQTDLYE